MTPDAPPAPAQDATTSVFREAAFLRLWAGATASGLATWALPFVLGLAVTDRLLSPAALGFLLATRTAGFLVAVPLGGVLADRHSRRAVVRWAGLAAAGATPLVGLGLAGSVVAASVAAVVVGAGQGACRPAYQALTAEVVDPSRRQQANAAMTLSVRVSTLLAPGLTALLATVVDVRALLLGTAVLWLVSALAPARGGPAPAASSPAATSGRGELVREFADGVREARRHPWFLAGLAALATVITTGYSATGVALPLVSRDEFGSAAVLAGALTAYTAGALLGALVVARWRPRAPGWAALAGLAAYAVAPASLLVPIHPTVVVGAYVVAGVGIELFNVPWFTAVQREIEPRLLARVSSLDFLVSYGLAPVGLALVAPAIDVFGTTAVLATCALSCLLVPAAAALLPGTRSFSTRPG